jgi:hypothetical protein
VDTELKYGVEPAFVGVSSWPIAEDTCTADIFVEDFLGGEKSAKSFEQAAQRAVPMRLHVSQCPHTMPISCSSVAKIPSVSQCEAPF